jgi:uncharacterized protein (TIGR00299 family) protein
VSAVRRILFVDGSSGASGDMILGALVDLGVPFAPLHRALRALPLDGWTARSRRLTRCGLVARKIDVRVRHHEHGRGFKEIRRLLRDAALPAPVRERAVQVFRRLLEAEAAVHGRTLETVHLHEAGGTDAIVDVVGACLALERLAPDRVVVSTLTTGSGRVDCAHGRYPVPGPATLELVRGVPVRAGDLEVERLTPTGAAILTAIADAWGPMPEMRPVATGYGAGTRDLGDDPNCLRMVLGESAGVSPPAAGPADASGPSGEVVVLECNLDDCTPQVLAWTVDRLLDAGALDVCVTGVTMKKGRAGHLLTVLARPEKLGELSGTVLRETTSFGLRARIEHRIELERRFDRVRTAYGVIPVKVGLLDGRIVQSWPEHDDCVRAAKKHEVALKRVQQAALAAWTRNRKNPSDR